MARTAKSEAQKQRRDARLAAGLCRTCGLRPKGAGKECDPCRLLDRQQKRARWAKKTKAWKAGRDVTRPQARHLGRMGLMAWTCPQFAERYYPEQWKIRQRCGPGWGQGIAITRTVGKMMAHLVRVGLVAREDQVGRKGGRRPALFRVTTLGRWILLRWCERNGYGRQNRNQLDERNLEPDPGVQPGIGGVPELLRGTGGGPVQRPGDAV